MLMSIKKILLKNIGENPVFLLLPQDGSWREIEIKSKVKISPQLTRELENLLPPDCVQVK